MLKNVKIHHTNGHSSLALSLTIASFSYRCKLQSKSMCEWRIWTRKTML